MKTLYISVQHLSTLLSMIFCHASPTVWNSLPKTVISDLTVTIGTFKSRLKSALYSHAFLQ